MDVRNLRGFPGAPDRPGDRLAPNALSRIRRLWPQSLVLSCLALLLLGGCPASEPPASAGSKGADSQSAPRETPPLAEDLIPAFRQIEAGSYGPARLRLRRVLAERPEDGQAHFLLGLSFHQEKQYARAAAHFEAATEHTPNYGPAWYFLGWARFYLGEPEPAESAFERHRAMHPEEPDTRFALGLIAMEYDDLREAERHFRTSIELLEARGGAGRDIAKARVRIADIMMLNGDDSAARSELVMAIALHHESYEAHYKLSRVLTRLGDDEAAARSYATFLELRERIYPQTRFPE